MLIPSILRLQVRYNIAGVVKPTVHYYNEEFRRMCTDSNLPVPLSCLTMGGAIESGKPALFHNRQMDYIIMWTAEHFWPGDFRGTVDSIIVRCFNEVKDKNVPLGPATLKCFLYRTQRVTKGLNFKVLMISPITVSKSASKTECLYQMTVGPNWGAVATLRR